VYIERRYYLANQECRAGTCIPQDTFDISPETQVLVRLTLTLPERMHYLVVEDFIPAGAEIVDTSLNTTVIGQGDQEFHLFNPFDTGGNSWIFGSPHIYKDRAWWVSEYVPAGTYEIIYRLQPLFAGEFRALPAHAYQYYFPDVEGASGGALIIFR
ncbi:MAG TPA: hypothetical protein VLH85_01245, partial [Levilinea sp.]|nr:hypothetical protein [Levilinea sp.]